MKRTFWRLGSSSHSLIFLAVARKITILSYKSDDRKKQTEGRKREREKIIRSLGSSRLNDEYGFEVRTSALTLEGLAQDGSAERLDAVLCAVQAAWAYSRRPQNFGIPADCDRLEGWIVDPKTLSKSGREIIS